MAWILLSTVLTLLVGFVITYNNGAYNVDTQMHFYQLQNQLLPEQRAQHYGGYGSPYIVIYPSEQEPIFIHDTMRPSRPRPSKTRSKTPLFPITTRPIREWLSSLAARRVTVVKTQTVTRLITTTKITATRCVAAKIGLEVSRTKKSTVL